MMNRHIILSMAEPGLVAFTGAVKLKTVIFTGKKAVAIGDGAFKNLKTKQMTAMVHKKMSRKQFGRQDANLKDAGFRGKVKRAS